MYMQLRTSPLEQISRFLSFSTFLKEKLLFNVKFELEVVATKGFFIYICLSGIPTVFYNTANLSR